MRWSHERVLVLAPHADDEAIGCGGLISRVKSDGGEVYVLFVTVGDTADFTATGLSTQDDRFAEIDKVAAFLELDGYHVAYTGADHHLRLDQTAQHDLVTMLERTSPLALTTVEPTVVVLPEVTSYNQDHRATALAAATALRPGDDQLKHQPRLVLSYEEVADGWSLEQPPPRGVFVELGEEDLDHKIAALSLHTTQVRDHPSTRSEQALRGLAAVRGAQCGARLAEAFGCLRWRV